MTINVYIYKIRFSHSNYYTTSISALIRLYLMYNRHRYDNTLLGLYGKYNGN